MPWWAFDENRLRKKKHILVLCCERALLWVSASPTYLGQRMVAPAPSGSSEQEEQTGVMRREGGIWGHPWGGHNVTCPLFPLIMPAMGILILSCAPLLACLPWTQTLHPFLSCPYSPIAASHCSHCPRFEKLLTLCQYEHLFSKCLLDFSRQS